MNDFYRFVQERANALAEAIEWVLGIDDRPAMEEEAESDA